MPGDKEFRKLPTLTCEENLAEEFVVFFNEKNQEYKRRKHSERQNQGLVDRGSGVGKQHCKLSKFTQILEDGLKKF